MGDRGGYQLNRGFYCPQTSFVSATNNLLLKSEFHTGSESHFECSIESDDGDGMSENERYDADHCQVCSEVLQECAESCRNMMRT